MKDLQKKFLRYKVGKYFRYKYTPDDVVFQVKKIKYMTPSQLTIEVYWLGAAISQDVVLTDSNVDSYEETV